jgi:hypothetical protein
MRRSMAAGSTTSGRSGAVGAAGKTVALESSSGVGCRTVAMLHYRLQTLRLAELAQIATSRLEGAVAVASRFAIIGGRRRIEGRRGRGQSVRDRFWAIFAVGS